MKKLTEKRRHFLMQKSKKEMLRRSRIKRCRTYYSLNRNLTIKSQSPNTSRTTGKYARKKIRELRAPENLSLFGNPEETIQYFKKVHNAINGCLPGDYIFFDLSSVVSISVDAIMYIIALLHNEKRLQKTDVFCGGNEPSTTEARKIIDDVGFYEYVESKTFHPTNQDSKLIRIFRGYKPDYPFAAKICDFVHVQSDNTITRIGTKRLYAMLVELMNNTFQHAYEDSSTDENSMYCNWYIFVEDQDDVIRFVFLDTGLGIPKTIRRSVWEKAIDIFRDNDARYISSALKGEFRTETEEEHRGKGLPEIYENVLSGSINSLSILSGQRYMPYQG